MLKISHRIIIISIDQIKHNKIIGFNSKKELDKIIIESPPDKFDYDLSSNIALVLSKKINQNPRVIADKIKNILQKEIKDFSDIYIAGPGFLNFNLSHKAWINIINICTCHQIYINILLVCYVIYEYTRLV